MAHAIRLKQDSIAKNVQTQGMSLSFAWWVHSEMVCATRASDGTRKPEFECFSLKKRWEA